LPSLPLSKIYPRTSLSLLALAKKIIIELSPPSDDCVVQCDEDKIITVILNLIENALKYSPENAVIRAAIACAPPAKNLDLTIKNPYFVEKIDLDLLTSEFYRGDVLTNGAGLGLWICQKVMQLHKGALTLSLEDDVFTCLLSFPLSQRVK